MSTYVLGFCFWEQQVYMVMKKEGDPCGAGLNGVGGGQSNKESALYAMKREWFEETGMEAVEWIERGTIGNLDFNIDLFAAFVDERPAIVGTPDMEGLWIHLGDIMDPRATIVPWAKTAIAMCMERAPSDLFVFS